MLILKNIGFPIATMDGVYTSVMEVWLKAMATLDKLIQGMPQRVQEGAVLLGLSAWHLYPDMCALGHDSTMIHQKDVLIHEGGIITLGLANADPDRDDGIYWSLPLAHLRYYGDPVTRTASAGDQSSRVSVDQLQQVALGSILGTWGRLGTDLSTPVELISTIFDIVYPDMIEGPGWVRMVASAAQRFLQSHGKERAAMSRLVNFGIRRCPNFIAEAELHPAPVFGLSNMKTLINLCPSIDAQLTCLRKVAGSFGIQKTKGLLIRYLSMAKYIYTYFELVPRQGTKRTRAGVAKGESHMQDMHWVINEDLYPDTFDLSAPSRFTDEYINDRLIAVCPPAIDMPPTAFEFLYGDPKVAAVFRPSPEVELPNWSRTNIVGLDQLSSVLASGIIDRKTLKRHLDTIGLDQSSSALVSKSTDWEAILTMRRRLGRFVNNPQYSAPEYFDSLDALHEAQKIFGRLSNAAVDLKVTSKPLYSWKWRASDREGQEPSLAHAFACIATFETGNLDLDPSDIRKAAVMALSCGNSMYVAERMLSDPSEILAPYAVRRIIGNIGRPGLSLLVPPERPRLPKPDYTSWNMVNHSAFDGHMEDNFAGTSLHLSFSEYQLAVDIGAHGGRDQEACYIEAIVSVYDRGRWIADLDILRANREWVSHAIHRDQNTNADIADATRAPLIAERLAAPTFPASESLYHMDFAQEEGQRSVCSRRTLLEAELGIDIDLGDFVSKEHDGFFNDSSFGRTPSDWVSDIETRLRNGDGEYAFEFVVSDEVHDTEVPQQVTRCQHTGDDRMDTSQLMPMVSIDSWAEFFDPPSMNAVVRARDNRLGRLCLAAVAMQEGYNIHILSKESCWKCDFEQCATEEQHNERIRGTSKEARRKNGTIQNPVQKDQPQGSFHLFIC